MIVIRSGSCPVIDGTDISVYAIKLLLDNGENVDEIVSRYRKRFPKLTAKLISQAYNFATNNPSL